ncbi:class F sortase [Streptomyces camponoticapitis]|uniref:Class F sortase n=1 Tax=Streptomyces camponoticapitis TaxID=1616125 RepID=A0ABQ2E496_9ACTN|nr:class F sortase [Streptomyces camponoticapitis]GGJ88233.1 class F sortase [Streptomyces camponoticapitis]
MGDTAEETSTDDRPTGSGRLLTGVAWAVLLLGLWGWGHDGIVGASSPMTGDVAAVGRPMEERPPAARDPRQPAEPRRIEVPSVGIRAPVVPRGLDPAGAVEPPPYELPETVGWYGGGARPGATGTALFVGHVDTRTEPAVFYDLSATRPGEKIRVSRADSSVAEFTIDDVRVYSREKFDARKVYGPHEPDRAELRLITCGGTFDRESRTYTANVVVSAYLTGVKEAPRHG